MKPNVTILGGCIEQKEIDTYIQHIRNSNNNQEIDWLKIELDGDYVNLSYQLHSIPFERIRRITGYLVGTLDRFNDGKRAEERDRVKHM